MREDGFPSAVSVVADTLADMSATICSSVTDIYQAQLGILANAPAILFSSVTDAYQAQLGLFANAPALLSEASSVIADEAKLRETRSSAATSREHRKISQREYAAWLTVITFLVVYISCAVAIEHSSRLAEISATDGPAPLDAAMAMGALVFWAWMNRGGGSSDE
jgi:hypothetical protein